MSAWRVDWKIAARAALRSIPWRDAARVDAAVMLLASSGQGELEGVTGDPRGAWLRLAGYRVRLELDTRTRQITVLYVWQSDR